MEVAGRAADPVSALGSSCRKLTPSLETDVTHPVTPAVIPADTCERSSRCSRSYRIRERRVPSGVTRDSSTVNGVPAWTLPTSGEVSSSVSRMISVLSTSIIVTPTPP